MKTIVKTNHAPAPIGPYNQAVVANGIVYCSGQVAIDPKDGSFCDGSIADETRKVISNLEAVLKAANSGLEYVLKCSIFLINMDDFKVVNTVYAEAFDNAEAPARETVEVSRLPANARVEISCIAAIK
jgi:2-iminobutanoate/2-iminopropanoate deaminase